ncbi:MAG: alpha/beta hydrolase [Chitinophagaceae bacterium]
MRTLSINFLKLFFLIMLVACNRNTQAQQGQEIPLWPQGVPDSNGITEPEVKENSRVRNVTTPTLFVYLPAQKVSKKNIPAVVICPGGGYSILAIDHEGHEFAKWLNERGIAAFVLKYRLPNKHSFIPLEDAQQAMRLVRSKAGAWNLDPKRVGVAGFSAGGHLAASLSVLYNEKPLKNDPLKQYSARPDFSILIYPVISMETAVTHAGSRNQLLGNEPDPALEQKFTTWKQIDKKTPPAFLAHSLDDKAVPVENSRLYRDALQRMKIRTELLEIPTGGHGWGMRKNDNTYHQWLSALDNWLKPIVK